MKNTLLTLLLTLGLGISSTYAYTGTIIDPLNIHSNKGEITNPTTSSQKAATHTSTITSNEVQKVAPNTPSVAISKPKTLFFSGTLFKGKDGWEYDLEYTAGKFLHFKTQKNLDAFVGKEVMAEIRGSKEKFVLQQVYVRNEPQQTEQSSTFMEKISNLFHSLWFKIIFGILAFILIAWAVLLVIVKKNEY